MKAEYIEDSCFVTEKVKILYRRRKPRQAIILAAGFGMRMVPIQHGNAKGTFGSQWRAID